MADTSVSGDASIECGKSGIFGPYWVDTLQGVVVWIDGTTDISYSYTDDGGATWSKTEIQAGTAQEVACWFDKETPGDTGTLLHITWLDSASNVCRYVAIDVDGGTQGTIRLIASVTVSPSTSAGIVGITKTVSGNLIVAYSASGGDDVRRSTDLFVSSNDSRTSLFEGAADYVLLYPANTGDDDDACALFWDISADAISIKMYDETANTWTETAIASSMVEDLRNGWGGVIRHSDNHLLVAAHTGVDVATDDIKTWDITVDSIASPTVTPKTDMVTNVAESGGIAMMINQQNDDVYIAYLKGGTWRSTLDVVYHKSDDGMATWGSEQAYSEDTADDLRVVHCGRTVGDDGGRVQFFFFNDDTTEVYVNLTNDIEIAAVSVGGRIMSSLINHGGLAGLGGIAGRGGGLAG
jgi:hypothetical protein